MTVSAWESPFGGRHRCIVMTCLNPPVRVMEHKDDPSICFGICALHVRTGLKYMTEEQQRDMVIPRSTQEATA